MPKNQQEIAVRFKDIIVDGIPSVEFNLEVPEEAKTLSEPTPAMWVGVYLTHLFNSGQLMDDAQKFVREGQFVKT